MHPLYISSHNSNFGLNNGHGKNLNEVKNMVSKNAISPDFNEDGEIIDFIEGNILLDSPEERVRQRYLKILHYDYKYPKNVIKREVPIFHGRNELKNSSGNPIRADIVVYEDKTSCINRNQGKIRFVVECKSPTETDGYNQLFSYIFNTSSNGGVWFNGSGEDDQVQYFRRIIEPEQELIIWPNIPRYKEAWDSVGRRRKSDLLIPQDIKGIFRRCHNRLHKQGSEEDDLTMDMVRIILAKTRDEEREGEWPSFYCTPEEYRTSEGKKESIKSN